MTKVDIEPVVPLDPPAETWKDYAYEAGVVGVNAATLGYGGTLLSMVVGTPLGRRRQKFEREVSERIQAMEKQGLVTAGQLGQHEQFVSTYVESTLAAIKTHNERKRAALRNAILNAALPGAPDETRQAIFVRWVDELTEMHLIVLEFCRTADYQPGRLELILGKKISGLEESGLFAVITNELTARNLIRPDSFGGVFKKRDEKWATPLGMEFLSFIDDPDSASDADQNGTK